MKTQPRKSNPKTSGKPRKTKPRGKGGITPKTAQLTRKKYVSASTLEPVVGIVMGSDSDLVIMSQAAEALDKFKIPYELRIVSAHRTPDLVMAYGGSARSRGLRVIIAGAGGAAHLPGMMAAHTTVPVIGVPVPHGPLQGTDALYSIVQMPKGVPVGTMAIAGAWNAGIFAAQILSLGTGAEAIRVAGELGLYKQEMEDAVARMNDNL